MMNKGKEGGVEVGGSLPTKIRTSAYRPTENHDEGDYTYSRLEEASNDPKYPLQGW
jgi:hypothetical protein